MSAATIDTIVKMLETLPEPAQEQVAAHLREYLQEVRADLRWDDLFARSQDQLAQMAEQARRDIADGKAMPFDLNQL